MAILIEASKSNAERTFPAGWGIAPPAAAHKAESHVLEISPTAAKLRSNQRG
jgi:hypothetical protein